MKKMVWLLVLLLGGCANTMPAKVKPVENFELNRYLGRWYEIARLDHSFERGLNQVTADYSLRNDGGIKVLNRGFSPEKNEWNEAEGKAYFVDEKNKAHLKVSFFGPFYGAYVIFELDQENYQYALVSGPDTSYLWILAREPQLDKKIQENLIATAAAAGFDTSRLIFVEQSLDK
jgi:apolipoprotein D and lipocalin family protein